MSTKQIIRVRDVMEANFHTIDGMATITDALQAMKKLGAQGLIVDKRHDDDEYGMLLVSDIARHVLGKDRAPDRVNVYEVMAKPVITVDPEMDIRYCARLFTRFELSRAPVVENSRVVGIVSFSDLVLEGLYRHI
ncbi:CBS domain-containing protein [Nitrogeniibacter aestuarii]|uniref:CBS domain-containing protein n=1 Tax=Nitrogeniibacter aestuarii TaxID=2815343 RepID=UPI001D12D084|nr:CBS domain-containing protein [Nitrogeniibacter aestuarii]